MTGTFLFSMSDRSENAEDIVAFYFRLLAPRIRDSNQTSTTGIRARLRCNEKVIGRIYAVPLDDISLFQSVFFIVDSTKVAIPGAPISLHFLGANHARRTSTPVPRSARDTYVRFATIGAQASGEYISSRLCRRWRAREKERARWRREIYSRELSGTVQFSWIVGRGMRYCPTSPGLPSYFLFISSTDCSIGCFSLFPRERKFFYITIKQENYSDNYYKSTSDLAKSARKFLEW